MLIVIFQEKENSCDKSDYKITDNDFIIKFKLATLKKWFFYGKMLTYKLY